MTRVAILGVSHWHTPLYLDALKRHAEVVVVSDDSLRIASEVAEQVGAQPTTSWEAATNGPGLDLVFVLGRHVDMPAIASACIAKKIPTVLEKPGGLSRNDVSELRNLAEGLSVPVAVPFVQRLSDVPKTLRLAGTIRTFTAQFIAGPPSRYLESKSPWMLDPAIAGGGSFINLGPHFIDMFRLIAGDDMSTVSARAGYNSSLDIEDHAVSLLATRGGATGVVEVGYLFPDSPAKRHISYTASGSDGFVSIESDGAYAFHAHDGHVATGTIEVDSDPLYGVFTQAVLGRVRSGFYGLPDLSDLEQAMRVVDEAKGYFEMPPNH